MKQFCYTNDKGETSTWKVLKQRRSHGKIYFLCRIIKRQDPGPLTCESIFSHTEISKNCFDVRY